MVDVCDEQRENGGMRCLRRVCSPTSGALAGAKAYTPLKSLRIWGGQIKDDGVASVAEILRLGGAEGAAPVAEVLRQTCTKIEVLNLKGAFAHVDEPPDSRHRRNIGALLLGNRLSNEGLRALSEGVAVSKSLATLDVTDNAIAGFTPPEIEALGVFALAGRPRSDEDPSQQQSCHGCSKPLKFTVKASEKLTTVKMAYNALTDAGGQALLPAVQGNERLATFVVDAGLSEEMYTALLRSGGGGKKGKGKKKGGKKKKK
eukprot:scaffold1659_cov255-Pinguiococcus_pyrenoidosus.AAC.38